MDSGYLDWMRSEHDRHVRHQKAQARSAGNRKRIPKSAAADD